MMDNKVKNLWKNIQKHGRLLESYAKKYYKNGYYTTNTYEYNDKIYFAIFHNWGGCIHPRLQKIKSFIGS